MKTISRTGTSQGLKLTINLEQYEYMNGPNQGAGIKLLIHDNDDVALVDSIGMGIPHGSNAYVGLEITKFSNLEKPYGQCNRSMEMQFYKKYTEAACRTECITNYLQTHCKEF